MLSSRIEAQTAGTQVLVSAAVAERAAHIAQLGPVRSVQLKGLPEPMGIRELLGVTAGCPGTTSER